MTEDGSVFDWEVMHGQSGADIMAQRLTLPSLGVPASPVTVQQVPLSTAHVQHCVGALKNGVLNKISVQLESSHGNVRVETTVPLLQCTPGE